MAISILGGLAKGLQLKVPPGDQIRPMAVMLKRKVFDTFQDLSGAQFVDLCAGSGAVGLEAWSRGADEVFLSEMSKKVFSFTEKNIQHFQNKFQQDFESRPLSLINKPCQKYLKDFKNTYLSWDQEKKENTIFFLAPPYPDHFVYEEVLNYLKQDPWFEGQLWVESDDQKGPPQEQIIQWSGEPIKKYFQGTTFLFLINY